MKKQLMIVGIFVILLTVGLSGCTSNPLNTEKNKFVGTWNTIYETYTFFSDGTCSISGLSGTYDIKDGKLVINAMELMLTFSYLFSNNDNTLTLTMTNSGLTNSYVFTKQ